MRALVAVSLFAFAAALFTPLGLVPEGNTGGTDVNGLRRMKLPQDLQSTIAAARG